MAIRVLIVDDSLLIRQMFSSLLSGDPEIDVVGMATDPMDAREKIKALNPDVITLDVEMPKMDGLSFLEKLMRLRPMPVVMVSSLTQKGATATIRALELGAVDVVPKETSTKFDAERLGALLISKVKLAAASRPRMERYLGQTKSHSANQSLRKNGMIAIGSSTGGVEALREILVSLPAVMPPIVITQHMPPLFTKSFAERLNSLCHLHVQEAKNGMMIEGGNAYLAPGDRHLEFVPRAGGGLQCRLRDGELVSGHRPSVDVMFHSVARHVGKGALGIILTGMGKDGAKGLLAMREQGAVTLGQNEASCVVYGMPKAAKELEAVMAECALTQIPDKIIDFCQKEAN